MDDPNLQNRTMLRIWRIEDFPLFWLMGNRNRPLAMDNGPREKGKIEHALALVGLSPGTSDTRTLIRTNGALDGANGA